MSALQQTLAAAFSPETSALGPALETAKYFWASLPTFPIFVGHCVFCSTYAPETRRHFLLNYWLTFLSGFGGGLASALLLMRPDKAPISFMSTNRSGVTFALVWWLMTYSPLAPALRAILALRPVKAVCRACVAFSRANLIGNRVVLVAQLHPGILMAPIIVGTISACGGKSSHDAIRHIYGLGTGPSEVTVPSYSFRSAFLGTCFFYLSAVLPATRFLSTTQASGALITLFVTHALAAELTGLPLDWSAVVMRLVLRLANIPWPSGVPLPAPAKPALSSGTAKGQAPHPPPHSHQKAAHEKQQQCQAGHQPEEQEEEQRRISTRPGGEAQAGRALASGAQHESPGSLVEAPSPDAIRAMLKQSAAKAAGKTGGGGGKVPKDDEWHVVPVRGKKTQQQQQQQQHQSAEGKKSK